MVKEVFLGKIEPGVYKLSFDTLAGSGGKTMIAISQGRIKTDALNHLTSIVSTDDNVPLIDIVDRDVNSTLKHEKNFTIDLPSSRDYYLYLYSLNSEGTEVNIKDLAIKTAIRNDDIQLVCTTTLNNTGEEGKDLTVTRHSPVRYSIDLPRGYKGFLSFNQTHSPDWEAYDDTGRTFPHYASGYSNAWFIDGASDDKITIKFKRHKNVEKLGAVSIIATIIMFMIYLRLWKK
ncbi:MAG: hypothetical protein ACD_37C00188G0001 [uncultured bacterium]|nr:MAG: hypothetical protein ACD_37C00188G0001 [uncultured bacterium]